MGISKAVCIVLAVAGMAAAQDDPPGRVGRLNYLSGMVTFQPAGIDDWVNANLNRPLTTGDRLWADTNGRAEVHIGAAALRLSSSTAFEFLNLDDRNAQIRLAGGSIEIRLRYLGERQTFEVDTPNLAFSLLRPGTYRIDADPDSGTTVITVRDGEGEATGGGQAFAVDSGQQARVTGDASLSFDLYGAPPPDGFDRWSLERDRREDASQSAKYCSREMIGYEDLDAGGSWRSAGDYGMTWFPRDVPAGWAPYRNGHWAWVDPWGWTWVDDAQWGFAPFHYGRWALVSGSWGWIPGPIAARPVYAPALVAWVGGAHFNLAISGGGAGMAWFALGPREVYVPSYHVSPAYATRVNVTNTVVNETTVVNVYKTTNITNIRYVNQGVPNAVTAVSRETFVNARPVAQAAVKVSAEQIRSAEVVRVAAVAPSRMSVLGHATVATSTARPPAAVLARTVVAKATPPPPPVGFRQREQALQKNPGQPVAPVEMQRLRAQSPAAPRPLVQQAKAVPPGQVHLAPKVSQAKPAAAAPTPTATPTPAPRAMEHATPAVPTPKAAPQNPRAAEHTNPAPNAQTTPQPKAAPQNPRAVEHTNPAPNAQTPPHPNPAAPRVANPPQPQPKHETEHVQAKPAEHPAHPPTPPAAHPHPETKQEGGKPTVEKPKAEHKDDRKEKIPN